MNKDFYLIIFNARRGIRMAVAETAASQGKSASGETGATATQRPRWTLTAFASLIAINSLTGFGLQAQVIADRNAPSNQRPIILQTANGVPQVNIQTPSAAGVSRNVYSQFDVQSKGVILNNSRIETPTQIGGYVQGNPWLANGSARVILNEVNSSTSSQLKGYVEVAGQRAEVIIANPAGIAVNGGGFINASAVTLTTGSVVMNAGNLESYQVRNGTVTFEGAGLDTSTIDYTNILARAVAVNAGIWAKDLHVVTGANDINAASVAAPVVTSTTAGTGVAPSFALDVAAIGGMYAGKIYLIGTEAGLGIRNAGTIAASAGNVTLSNDGWISNSGSVYATGNTSITAQGTVSITGTGLIAAAGNTTVAAQGTGSQVGIASGATVAAGMGTTGAIGSTGNLTIQSSNTTTILGQLASGGDTALSASTLILDDARVSGKNVQLIATATDISAKRATVSASETLSATTLTRLVTDGATVTAKQLTLAAHDISNVAGRLQQSGTGNTSITLAGRLDNTNGTIAVNSNQLDIAVQSLNNTAGMIASNNSLSITIGTDTTQTGSILANKDLTFSTTANLVNSGKIQAGENLSVNANALDNTVTGELSSTATTLNVSGSFTNRGLVDGGNNAGTGSTSIQAATVNNVGTGLIYGDKVGIATTTLNNDAETVGGITKAATIAARDRLDIGTSTLNNSQGSSIRSLGDMALGGSLDANGQAAGHAGTINNSASTIESFGNMRIAATSINNLNPNLQWESDTGTTGPSGSVYFTQAGTFDTATGGLLSTTAPLTPQYRGGYAYYQVTDYVPEELCSGGAENENADPRAI
ncbi:MAG: filamentous hemagglutinin N-terminal domain-containing protein [Comamonadaceae bacterium]|nr:MAG: filamentous hemagglutinin N-terminal domain-containing protein [Comamonadaceae bacterium]